MRVAMALERTTDIDTAREACRVTDPIAAPRQAVRGRWSSRLKASLLGGLAATLASPILFLAVVLATPPDRRGFWQQPTDVLLAVHVIWLFAGVVALPTGAVFGPFMLAAVERLGRARMAAAVTLGATLGAAAMNSLPLVVRMTDAGFSPALTAFAAAMGGFGAGVATALRDKLY